MQGCSVLAVNMGGSGEVCVSVARVPRWAEDA